MTGEIEALRAVLARVAPFESLPVALLDSFGRFATHDIYASRPLPPFDNSSMDGYAVVAGSCRAGARLRVIGEQPAGEDRGLTIQSGEAVRIFTGAPIPMGADAVIMQEDTKREGDFVIANCDVDPGEFVRRKGADLAHGQKILSRGERISITTAALLASQGMTEIEVGRRARVAIVSTGDEVARPGESPKAGQIFESNSILLQGLTTSLGAEVTLVEHCKDDFEQLKQTFSRALENDALVVSGGVSVGEHDLVKPVLHSLGVSLDLWRVALKPGKPFLFGRGQSCSVFGLPGNPVSAFVTFLRFVRPAILKMMGAADEYLALRKVSARLTINVTNDGERPHYLRGRLENGEFEPIGRQESHALFGLSRANALMRLESNQEIAAGNLVTVELWE